MKNNIINTASPVNIVAALHSAVMVEQQESRAIGHRVRKIRERRGWSREQLADALGVHPGSVARWETGGSVPQAFHLEQISEIGQTTVEWIRTGLDPEADGSDREMASTSDVFGSLDAVARFLGGIAPPGEERLRKLDAMEGLRRMLTARGALPDWWYQLRERVEANEV